MGFDKWLKEVNAIFVQRIGLTLEDFEDFDYFEMYDEDMTPFEAYDEVSERILAQIYDFA